MITIIDSLRARFFMLTALVGFGFSALPSSMQAQDALSGDWQLIASPVGVEGEGGIMSSSWDYINFKATLSADGTTLTCHADQFFSRNGHAYPMDWLIAVEHNGSKTRLGWVCNAEQPVSSAEFQEPASAYAMGGSNQVEGEHRYLYMMSYNIETNKEEGMTIWSGWMDEGQTTFTLPQNQQLDCIVSTTIPCTKFVGYADSWASARITKLDLSGISELHQDATAAERCYDLQGRRLYGKPQRGLIIKGGRKYLQK
jgi:hypothetical protein